MGVVIYHNPRCSKSRAAKQFLEEQQIEHVTVRYLEQKMGMMELKNILKYMGNPPIADVIRKNESLYKELRLDDPSMTDAQIIAAIIANPILLQRPIVVNGFKAVVARPTEKIKEIL